MGKDPARLLGVAVGVMAGLCLVFMTLSHGLGHSVSTDIRLELEISSPTSFTVVARPPYGDRLRGPQGITLEQADTLKAELANVADMAMVTQEMSSTGIMMIKDGKTEILKNPVSYIGVDDRYFHLMGVPLGEGRGFTAEEIVFGTRVCVIGYERPETDRHSDPEGSMTAVYSVVGRLAPVDGDPYPLPKIWTGGNLPDFEPFRMNLVVLTPITARAPVPHSHLGGLQRTDTFVVPLVQPFPGLYEEATQIVSRFMENAWPGWALDFGVGNQMQVVLLSAEREVQAFFAQIGYLLLALFLVSAAGLVIVQVSRSQRDLAIRRAVGASRVDVLLVTSGRVTAAALVGAGGGLALVTLLGPLLSAFFERPFAVDLRPAAFHVGLVALAALISSVATTFWATHPEPARALRPGITSRAVPLMDIRVIFTGMAVLLAVASVTALMITGRASVATLQGYLRSAGVRTVVVSQDFALAERHLTGADTLRAEHAELLRSAVPTHWEGLYQASAPITIYRSGAAPIAVFAYGLDTLWPEGEGFAFLPEFRGDWDGDARVALIGETLARELFAGLDPVGQVIGLTGGIQVEIAGVLDPRPLDVVDPLGDRDMCLVLPDTILEALPELKGGQATRQVVFYVSSEQEALEAAKQLALILEEHGLTALGLRAEAAVDQVSALQTLSSRMSGSQLALAWMALLATAFMVGVTAHARVLERRREYGIKRAMGARPVRVAGEVVGVTVGLALLFALAGSAAGTSVARHICHLQDWLILDTLPAVAQAVACASGISLLASLWPASLVAGEEPLSALREGN